MSVVRMPGCFPERNDDCRPWTEYEGSHDIYILRLDDAAVAIANAAKREVLEEGYSGGKIVSFTRVRYALMKAAREAAKS